MQRQMMNAVLNANRTQTHLQVMNAFLNPKLNANATAGHERNAMLSAKWNMNDYNSLETVLEVYFQYPFLSTMCTKGNGSDYLKASPTGVPLIMYLALVCVNCTPFNRKSVKP